MTHNHHLLLLLGAGIVIVVLVLSPSHAPKPKAPPDGSWKVCLGFVSLAAAIVWLASKMHPAKVAPAPPPPVVTVPSHSMLSTWLIALAAAAIFAVLGWVVRRFR